MALPPPKTFRQDLPPRGGFTKPADFPVAGWRKRSPARGPAGIWLLGGVGAMVVFGWYQWLSAKQERKYVELSKWNERFERAYVLQAQENVSWERRNKEFLDKERELMASHPSWVVNRRRFFTQWEDKPDVELLDPRKPGLV